MSKTADRIVRIRKRGNTCGSVPGAEALEEPSEQAGDVDPLRRGGIRPLVTPIGEGDRADTRSQEYPPRGGKGFRGNRLTNIVPPSLSLYLHAPPASHWHITGDPFASLDHSSLEAAPWFDMFRLFLGGKCRKWLPKCTEEVQQHLLGTLAFHRVLVHGRGEFYFDANENISIKQM